jgi:hypothetical protein
MVKKNKKSKKCQTFLILLIIGIVILLGSIPLYIIGINKMNKQVEDSTVGQINLNFNTEEIIALCMSSLGMLMTVMFGLMYASCKK